MPSPPSQSSAPPTAVRATWWRSPNGFARVWVRPTWSGEGGVRHLLMVSVPLVVNGLTAAVNLFSDRYFLSHYDMMHHMPASQGAGTSWWTAQSMLVGVVGYISVFVAQYTGARRPRRIGPTVWQGMYIALAGGVINLALLPLWGPFFRIVHGASELSALEATYARILCLGSVFLLINGALSSFYAGRSRTLLVMFVGLVVTFSNVLLAKWWVFSPPTWLPFVHRGVSGAAWATCTSFAIGSFIYLACFLHPRNEAEFAARSGWRFDRELCVRILRYAVPQGLHMLVEVASFGIFVLVLGRLSPEAFIASTVALTINMLIFHPLMGVAQGVGILTGQFVGHGRPDLAERSTCAAIVMNTLAMVPVMFVFGLFPDPLVDLFMDAKVELAEAESVRALARIFLMWVVVYAIADAWNVTYGFAIKGAGDTKFVVNFTLVSSLVLFAIPCLLVGYFRGSPVIPWIAVTAFVFALGGVFFVRFRSGHWKSMQVIEAETTQVIERPEFA